MRWKPTDIVRLYIYFIYNYIIYNCCPSSHVRRPVTGPMMPPRNPSIRVVLRLLSPWGKCAGNWASVRRFNSSASWVISRCYLFLPSDLLSMCKILISCWHSAPSIGWHIVVSAVSRDLYASNPRHRFWVSRKLVILQVETLRLITPWYL